MYDTDPFSHNYMYSPLCKRKYTDIQAADVTAETNQLVIRSPGSNESDIGSQSYPFKRSKEDNHSNYLSANSSSPLAHMDLQAIFNWTNFQRLPLEKQDELAKLLPTPDTFTSSIMNTNITYVSSSSTAVPLNETIPHTTLRPSFFSRLDNTIFWSALDDWQSMLASDDLVSQDQENPSSETNSSFKDDAFELYWGELSDREKLHNVAGDSKSITLKDMCRKGLIRENDIIVYKRNFSACKVIVSKNMKVVKSDGTLGLSITLDDKVYEDFETPTALETRILDHHGKVARDKRPNGNAFKSIRLFRDGKDMGRLFDIRKEAFGS